EIRLGNFDRFLHLVCRPEPDQHLAHGLVEFARFDRMSYIRTNDILDRLVSEQPEYLATFQRHVEARISEQCRLPGKPGDDWPHATALEHHHLFDLWADCIRRKLLKRVR